MTLQQVLSGVVETLNNSHPAEIAEEFLNFGFVTAPPESEQWTIRHTANSHYELVTGVRDAFIVFQAPLPVLEALFGGLSNHNGTSIDEMFQQVVVLPHDYANQITRFMQQVLHANIDLTRFKPPGAFPMPVVHPSGENTFRMRHYTPEPIPIYDVDVLPAMIADDHPAWVRMYNRAWEIAFSNLRQPEPDSGFIANFIDTAFNDNAFMWDSCFMVMFGHYARQVFGFMGTLDNFYAKQHADGFICREINTYHGYDLFMPQDSRSTGPNILAWTEWCDYQHTSDVDRLRAVFPALVAYHRWWQHWRSWPDGSYWNSGWGSGMDNQVHNPAEISPNSWWDHFHYSWIDATFQQALSCRILLQIAGEIGRDDFSTELEAEYAHLKQYTNAYMWDEASGFYYDRTPDGSLSPVKSIGAFWGLLAGVIPEDRAARMLTLLKDPAIFNRPHRVPSQAADSIAYAAHGQYWRGGVWSPTNYMVLSGLTVLGEDDLAYDIALNHVENVAHVFEETGTLWENYAPEFPTPSQPAKNEFVGWTGLSAINIPIEYLIGLRPVSGKQHLVWDVRLTEQHGVQRYPLNTEGVLDLICAARPNENTPPQIAVTTNIPFTLEVRWSGGSRTQDLAPGSHQLSFHNDEV